MGNQGVGVITSVLLQAEALLNQEFHISKEKNSWNIYAELQKKKS